MLTLQHIQPNEYNVKTYMSWFLWMTSCFHEILSQESTYPGIRWAPGKENSIRFLGTVTSYKALLGNFHLKSSMKCFQKKSLRLIIWSVLRKKSQSDLLKQWPHDTPMTTFLFPWKTQILQNIPRRNLSLAILWALRKRSLQQTFREKWNKF